MCKTLPRLVENLLYIIACFFSSFSVELYLTAGTLQVMCCFFAVAAMDERTVGLTHELKTQV